MTLPVKKQAAFCDFASIVYAKPHLQPVALWRIFVATQKTSYFIISQELPYFQIHVNNNNMLQAR